ncbi:MAG TPA: hypothetical protein VG457_00410, partial [Planctomycetota bacterium]|nr:hypothetical protein [Planctomycetota bacterium]
TILQETLTLINFDVDWKVNDEKEKDSTETHSIDFAISMFGLTTPPKRKPPAAPGSSPATAPISAPQGGAK